MITRAQGASSLAAIVLMSACLAPASYSKRGHYEHPETEPAPVMTALLLSAHVSRFGLEPSNESHYAGLEPVPLAETTTPRMVENSEEQEDRIVLLFARELDPLTIDARNFGVLRADGHRVRPTRVFLAPADEGDENRSLTLTGNFGSAEAPPVAIHVLGALHAETGEALTGLDADITGPEQPDRPLSVERLTSTPTRCPAARQVVHTYWTDTLTHVGDGDLAGIELRLADGRMLAPTSFDDQAWREDDAACEPPCLGPVDESHYAGLGPVDDNVLDLCVDTDVAVVHVRFAAGLFEDEAGHGNAAADLAVPAQPG